MEGARVESSTEPSGQALGVGSDAGDLLPHAAIRGLSGRGSPTCANHPPANALPFWYLDNPVLSFFPLPHHHLWRFAMAWFGAVSGPWRKVNKLEITPDKQYLAAAGNPHIRLFEVNTSNPQPVTSYDGHTGNVTAVGFEKDGRWMYSGSEVGHGA